MISGKLSRILSIKHKFPCAENLKKLENYCCQAYLRATRDLTIIRGPVCYSPTVYRKAVFGLYRLVTRCGRLFQRVAGAPASVAKLKRRLCCWPLDVCPSRSFRIILPARPLTPRELR